MVLGAGGIMQAVVTGMALQLGPSVTVLASSAGGIIGITIVTLAGERLRAFFLRWIGGGEGFQTHWFYGVWMRYGIPGLGLFGPILVNPPITAALGVFLGVPRARILAWGALGVIFGSALMAFGISAGWAGLQALFMN
jgi:Ca2+/H+ antiporter, TMEM165/GDT1 family